jgi:preprotein translocase subunit SecA
MDRLGLEEGEVIAHPMVTKAIGKAQQRVEAQNFGIRKRLLEYDDVMNTQREVIYTRRGRALDSVALGEDIEELILDYSHDLLDRYTEENTYSDQWPWDDLHRELLEVCFVDLRVDEKKRAEMTREDLQEAIAAGVNEAWSRKREMLGEDLSGRLERYAILRVIDEKWMNHLYEMDRLKEGISLRAYGQKDPLVEYKQEGYYLFMDMLSSLTRDTIQFLFRESAAVENQLQQQALSIKARSGEAVHQDSVGMAFKGAMAEGQGDASPGRGGPDAPPPGGGPSKRRPVSVNQAPGRNDPCHCGSGKKYKHCHGR